MLLHKRIIRKVKSILNLESKQHMLDFHKMVKGHGLYITGAIIIGAHEFREEKDYTSLGVKHFTLIEPLRSAFKMLEKKYKKNECFQLLNVGCSSHSGLGTLYTEEANDGQSSSLLTPDQHLVQYPKIKFKGVQRTNLMSLDSIDIQDRHKKNFLSLDVQGYELEVLKGAKNSLKHIQYILCEVNNVGASMYKGAADINDIDDFLWDQSFKRVTIPNWVNNSYTDCLYKRMYKL